MPTATSEVYRADFKVEILEAKEDKATQRGKVKALVSAYDVEYRMGWRSKHKITMGAFAESLAANANVPLFWQHNWSWSEQPPIGVGVASEESRGLIVDGEFFLDTEDGRKVFSAIKAGALREWSIGYRVEEYSSSKEDEDDEGTEVWNVTKAELMEASSVLRGANPDTDTLKVASAALKAAGVKIAGEADLATIVKAFAEFMAEQAKVNALVDEALQAQNELNAAQAEWSKATDDWCAHKNDDDSALADRVASIEEKLSLDPEASSGEESEETSVEGSDAGLETGAAPVPVPKVPDFLPPQAGDPSDPDDPTAITRVLKCWSKAQTDANIRAIKRIGSD